VKAHAPLLFSDDKPAQKVAKTPETRLGSETGPTKKPIVPPKIVDNTPTYGPSITPIIGAIIAATVMVLPGKPIMGEIDRKLRTTYSAAKQIANAKFLVESLRFIDAMMFFLLMCI